MMQYDREKVILVDCDGVLLNWEYAFVTWMKSKGYPLIGGSSVKYTYDILELFDITNKKLVSLINQFNSSAAMGFLPPLRDAIQYVRKLHQEHGYVFHMITSMSSDTNAHSLRRMNTYKLFGESAFEKFIFLDTNADKTSPLARYQNSGLCWIEDKVENAVVGKSLGLESILMEHSYNMDVPPLKYPEAAGIPRYAKWKDIYHHITGE